MKSKAAIIISAALIAGCSPSSKQEEARRTTEVEQNIGETQPQSDVTTKASTTTNSKPGWNPSDACDFLVESLPTRGYKTDYNDEYHCSSDYKDIGKASAGLQNNLAYYATGSASTVDTLKLVLNYNQPGQKSSATKALIQASKQLSIKATGNEPPALIIESLSSGKSSEVSVGEQHHQVVRDEWPNGNGYEVHYILKKI